MKSIKMTFECFLLCSLDCGFDDNGSDRFSKSSSWRNHMWFSTPETAGNFHFYILSFSILASLIYGIQKIHDDVPQEIWDEVGESDEERDKMLLQLEQECLDVYKRKVEQAAKSRAQLLQALSDGKLELSTLLSALGEKSSVGIVSITRFNFFSPIL